MERGSGFQISNITSATSAGCGPWYVSNVLEELDCAPITSQRATPLRACSQPAALALHPALLALGSGAAVRTDVHVANPFEVPREQW